ncbi:MAG: hypothetical protein U0Q22_09575 [Acidimicrobiales bacterium]
MSDSAPGTRKVSYEGFPVEAVLARVHAVHGTDVHITSAERVRRGGIGGFFARELFVVTVAVPVDDGTADEPRFLPLGRIGDDAPEVGTEEIDPEDIEGALSLAEPERAPVAERDDADAEIWALLAAAAVAPPAAAQVAAEVVELVAAEVAPPAPPVVAEVVEPVIGAAPIASTTLIPPAFIPAIANATAPAAAPSPAAPAPAAPAPAAPAPFLRAVPDADADVVSMRPHRLRRTISPPVDLADLIGEFESLPAAPPIPSSGIIAVVGNRIDALQVAGRLAVTLGIAPDDVIVAAPGADIVVPSVDDTMRLAATTRYRCNPVAIIAVELVAGRVGHDWARAVLDGLRAEQVRLAADTTRLLTQLHLSVAALGGVDVVDLLNAASHPEAASVIELGTPVATIDGRPATPEMWAATVLAGHLRETSTVDRFATGTR